MTKPTREEVLKIKTYIATWAFLPDQETLRNLCDAYLAQEEELKLLRESNERKSGLVADLTSALSNRNAENQELKRKGEQLCCRVGVLEMENQELKTSMEAEYIERQAKHIQALVKENEALKAFIGNMHVSIATPFFDSKLNRDQQP